MGTNVLFFFFWSTGSEDEGKAIHLPHYRLAFHTGCLCSSQLKVLHTFLC